MAGDTAHGEIRKMLILVARRVILGAAATTRRANHEPVDPAFQVLSTVFPAAWTGASGGIE